MIPAQQKRTASTLIRRAAVVVTMDSARRELKDVDILTRAGVIVQIGAVTEPADTVIDATDCIVTPGLVNTHHHLYQSLTRAVPACQDAQLFDWLRALYPIWARMTPGDVFTGVQLGLAELALSGCTMSADHLYLFPNGVRLDDTIAAAQTVGLRFHPTRGAMSVGERDGGLPPDALVERERDILEDFIRTVDAFHDPAEGAMVRVGLAPCSPFSVSPELMRDTALLAREKGVMLHTHLAEDDEDVAYSLERFGCRPGQYAEQLGWVGEDVWHAHGAKLDAAEIALFARTRTGVAHCPGSNCRLGSGIAPVRALRDAGVTVGLGVDGAASNDAGHVLSEARQAMLLQRVQHGAAAMSTREALEIATLGGAGMLGRPECGVLAPGRRADIAIWPMTEPAAMGVWDPVAALVLCGPHHVRDLLVDGRCVVQDGRLTTIDPAALRHNVDRCVARLMGSDAGSIRLSVVDL